MTKISEKHFIQKFSFFCDFYKNNETMFSLERFGYLPEAKFKLQKTREIYDSSGRKTQKARGKTQQKLTLSFEKYVMHVLNLLFIAHLEKNIREKNKVFLFLFFNDQMDKNT